MNEWTENCPTCGHNTLKCFEQACGHKKLPDKILEDGTVERGRIVATDVKDYQTCFNPKCIKYMVTVEYGKQWEDR